MKNTVLSGLIAISLLVTTNLLATDEKTEVLYQISYQPSGEVKVSNAAECNLTITPKDGWVLKTDTPFKAKLASHENLDLPKAKFIAKEKGFVWTSKDFVDAKATPKTILTSFTAKVAGPYSLNADLTFFVCSDTICKRQKDAAKCNFEVK